MTTSHTVCTLIRYIGELSMVISFKVYSIFWNHLHQSLITSQVGSYSTCVTLQNNTENNGLLSYTKFQSYVFTLGRPCRQVGLSISQSSRAAWCFYLSVRGLWNKDRSECIILCFHRIMFSAFLVIVVPSLLFVLQQGREKGCWHIKWGCKRTSRYRSNHN